MQITITTAGYNALVNADNSGTAAVPIGAVAFGRGDQPAAPDRTGLEHEVTRLDTIAGEAVSDRVIHVTVRDASDAAYTVREFGLYTDAGVLFGIYSQPDPIIEKSAGSWLLLDVDIEFMDVDVSQISFGDVSFSNPPWSESVKGVLARATQSVAEALTDNKTGMSPLRTAQAIASWLGASKPGAGGGLDADLLDGEHGSDYHKANNLTGTAPRKVLPGATTNAQGVVERATAAEASAGTDGQRYITPAQLKSVVRQMIDDQRNKDWPIGSTYTNASDSTNPGTFLPGTWEKIDEGFLYPHGSPDAGAVGSTGGQTKVALDVPHVPPHAHDADVSTAGNHQHTGYTSTDGNHSHKYDHSGGGGYKHDNSSGRGGDFVSANTSTAGDHRHRFSTTLNGAHSHNVTIHNTGGGQPHENMPPHRTVYMWERVS